MGIQLFLHAVQMVLRNLVDALKVSIGPFILGVLFVAVLFAVLGYGPSSVLMAFEDMQMMSQNPTEIRIEDLPGAGYYFGLLISLAVMIFVFAWVAVSWHRYVLVEEYPSMLPKLQTEFIWPYIGKTLLLTLCAILVMLVIMIPLGVIMIPLATASPVAVILPEIVLMVFLSYLFLRWSLMLPAAAIGKSMGISDGTHATSNMKGAVFVAAIMIMLLNSIPTMIVTAIAGETFVGIILNQIVSWFTMMVGIALLTTLYGVAVEGRAMPKS